MEINQCVGCAIEQASRRWRGGRTRREILIFTQVASYNVLSSKLCEPGYFIKCAKENLDPPTRLKRVQALLEQETKKNAVVCLQEVSREWSGDLHAFFARQGYQFTTGLYGNPFNGYMVRGSA